MQTLFLVHGMGVHSSTNWAETVWQKLIECSKRYPHFNQSKPLEEYATFAAIDYDSFITAALQRWKDQGGTFAKFAVQNGFVEADNLAWLDEVNDSDNDFLFTHLADALIYRYFENERGQIIDSCVAKFAAVIDDAKSADAESKFSVMAHSLGTAVAHDALHKLGTVTQIGGLPNAFTSKLHRFDTLHMLANVSRMLQHDVKAYKSVIRPGSSSTKNRYCAKMYTYAHDLDVFAKIRNFDPVAWGHHHELIPVDHVYGWNIHAWLHYLDNPRVHIPVLKSISKNRAISSSAEIEAVNRYSKYGNALKSLQIGKRELSRVAALLQSIDPDQSLADNIEKIRETGKILQRLKDLTDQTWASFEGLQA